MMFNLSALGQDKLYFAGSTNQISMAYKGKKS